MALSTTQQLLTLGNTGIKMIKGIISLEIWYS